ncbi:MAG: putative glutamine ABC transporter permease protein GlnM [Alphaproteobacteria bacterium MarineAlpha11_Bin1]|nr:MAG: putative glutamine ABC transporter permease protein GlnM [Alphaproteobacteria bacterium MarineAlpha11_Bin1]
MTSRINFRNIWFDKRGRGYLLQLLVLFGVAIFLAVITSNTLANLQRAGLTSGFGFLGDQAFFDINQRLIDYTSQSSFGRALIVGLLNTVLVSCLGIITATLIGFVAGILRLSNNWLVSRLITSYVEITRNVPLLLQIILWWSILTSLPKVRDSMSIFGAFFLNNRGLRAPSPDFEAPFLWLFAAVFLSVLATVAISIWSRRRQKLTGKTFPVVFSGLILLLVVPIFVFYLLGQPISWDIPAKTRFNFGGGFNITPELLALWVALATYTGAFISEIVRAGILSVSAGQSEAALSLGLRKNQTMRLVTIPQALRVIIPPLTSQYLNLTKNSSLAIAIGYQDLVSIGGTILNQSGHALEVVAIWMFVYLSLSLATSAFMNWYNKKMSLVER